MMTKIVDFLEQQVHWIAIGVGAIFLGLMVWWYVVANPITTEVKGTSVDLGSVDQTILDTAGKPLQQAIDSTARITSMGTPPEFSGPFAAQMDLGRQKYQGETIPGNWIESPAATGNISIRPDERVGGPVVSLPTPPAPQLVGILAARAQITTPVVGTGANAQPAGAEDKNWVTVEGKISITGLAAELTQAKFPAANQTTEFLRLELERQEQLPDGTWGNDTTVQPPAYLGIPPWPAAGNPAAAIQYALWAKTNVMLILQPPPFSVLKGKPWYLPSDVDTAAALNQAAGGAFDPSNLNVAPATPEQKKARFDYIQSPAYKLRREQERGQPQPPQPPIGAPPGGPGGAMGPRPDVTDQAVLAQANFPGGNFNGAPGASPPMPPVAPPQNVPPQAPPQVNASTAVLKANAELPPQGDVDPSKQPDVSCWAFDDTVQPGKTYRYRFRYMVLYPAHSSPIAGTPEVARQLALTSGYSVWSSATRVQPVVAFFVATGISSGSKVNFRIYKWQNGEITTVSEQDGAGDVVGALHANANNVNYTTDWTVVAIHRNFDGMNYVMLVNGDGQIVRRDYHSDELDPDYRDMRRAVALPTVGVPANGAVNPVAPMAPPPGPGMGGRF